jgi:glycosyltransferase involved in cell wall biosynthesis
MKILVYFRELNYGGVHTYLLHQVEHLLRNNHEVWVTYSKNETRRLFKHLGAKTFCNKELQRPIRIHKDLYALWNAYWFCKSNKIDCVFSHTSKGGVIGRLAGYFARVPKRIHVIHGFSFHEFSSMLNKIVLQRIERVMARFATKLISVNQDDGNFLINSNICERHKVYKIHNGVKIPDEAELMGDLDRIRFLGKEEIDHNKKIVLYVGRLDKQKNPIDLISVFSSIQDNSSLLVIIGEGPLMNKCKELVNKKGLNQKIKFLGFRTDVNNWYQICSIYVIPSLWEGLPMTLLEAMSFGACCVATNVKGNRECIENGKDGILFSPKQPVEFSHAISILLNDIDKRRNLGNAAREKIVEQFSVQRMCAETYKIICE